MRVRIELEVMNSSDEGELHELLTEEVAGEAIKLISYEVVNETEPAAGGPTGGACGESRR